MSSGEVPFRQIEGFPGRQANLNRMDRRSRADLARMTQGGIKVIKRGSPVFYIAISYWHGKEGPLWENPF